MARKPSPTDFLVPVEGVGDFVFAKRMMADEINIQVEYARIVQGVEPTEWLRIVGACLSDLRILTVSAPANWDLDELDPLDNDTYVKLVGVHTALRNQESSFRRPKGEANQAIGA